MFVRSAYNYDRDAASLEAGVNCGVDPVTGEVVPSMTQQHFKDECDINVIVKRHGLGGQLPENVRMPSYGDFTGVSSYQEALNAMILADNAFMAMPADVRARFDNDPGKFVDFCSDSANLEEARKLGLVKPEEVPEVLPPVEVRIVQPLDSEVKKPA